MLICKRLKTLSYAVFSDTRLSKILLLLVTALYTVRKLIYKGKIISKDILVHTLKRRKPSFVVSELFNSDIHNCLRRYHQ